MFNRFIKRRSDRRLASDRMPSRTRAYGGKRFSKRLRPQITQIPPCGCSSPFDNGLLNAQQIASISSNINQRNPLWGASRRCHTSQLDLSMPFESSETKRRACHDKSQLNHCSSPAATKRNEFGLPNRNAVDRRWHHSNATVAKSINRNGLCLPRPLVTALRPK